jgi:hypothetical protein
MGPNRAEKLTVLDCVILSAEYQDQDPLVLAKQAERDLISLEAKQGHLSGTKNKSAVSDSVTCYKYSQTFYCAIASRPATTVACTRSLLIQTSCPSLSICSGLPVLLLCRTVRILFAVQSALHFRLPKLELLQWMQRLPIFNHRRARNGQEKEPTVQKIPRLQRELATHHLQTPTHHRPPHLQHQTRHRTRLQSRHDLTVRLLTTTAQTVTEFDISLGAGNKFLRAQGICGLAASSAGDKCEPPLSEGS